jgi:hypothetical protein
MQSIRSGRTRRYAGALFADLRGRNGCMLFVIALNLERHAHRTLVLAVGTAACR